MAGQANVFQQKMSASLNDSEMSDVEFRIGNEDIGIQDFSGIRALFATQSDVLKRMLYGNMAESKSNNIVIIDDISPHTFDWFKKYCYGLNPRVTNDNIVNVLHFCDKYCMKELYDIYLKRLLEWKITNRVGESWLKMLNDLINKGMCHVIAIDQIMSGDKFAELTVEQCQMIVLPKNKSLLLSPEYIGKILFDSKIKLSQSTLWELLVAIKQKHHALQSTSTDKSNYNETKTNDISNFNSTIIINNTCTNCFCHYLRCISFT